MALAALFRFTREFQKHFPASCTSASAESLILLVIFKLFSITEHHRDVLLLLETASRYMKNS